LKFLPSKVAVIVAVLGMITVNALANILPINGVHTGEVSDSYRVFFVPAGYVFSIWGLIYLALLTFAGVQAFSSALEPLVAPVRGLFVVSCVANGAWIFCWHYRQLALSVAVMLVLLITLTLIYRRLRPSGGPAPSGLARWTVLAPMSLYLGWICVATVANVSDLLFALGWEGAPLTGPLWAAIMMAVASGIIVALALKFWDAIPPLVLIWALVGIVVKFPAELLMRGVGLTLSAGLLGLALLVTWRRTRPVDAGAALARRLPRG
jgi:hypothetical protein